VAVAEVHDLGATAAGFADSDEIQSCTQAMHARPFFRTPRSATIL
jgi:hypothetical protein